MWLACHTLEEISATESTPVKTVHDLAATFCEIGNLAKSAKSDAEHATDFDIPLYNVWKQQEKSKGSSHFGNSEARWVDNLLYLYIYRTVYDCAWTGAKSPIK